MGISNVGSTHKPRKNILQAFDHIPCWHDFKVESTKAKIEFNRILSLSSSLSWSDPPIRNVKAFIEFRTNILNKVNFSNFDNVHGVSREIIPNYIHYIRLEQPDIR